MILDHCYIGDCRDVMRSLIQGGGRVQTVVTSPPYWGLRDYGTGAWEGGTDGCDHARQLGGTKSSTLHEWNNGLTAEAIAEKVTSYGRASYRDRCGKCGARRLDRQLGLERTPTRYVARIRSVFRLVRELLADDGVLWLNLGDCYATGAGKVGDHPGGGEQGARWRGDVDRTRDQKRGYRGGRLPNQSHMGKHAYGIVDAEGERPAMGPTTRPNRMPIRGLKPKDLVGIPWRVAFALQADGWWLRNDIVWSKPNPMPESIKDRCTKSHEYLFLLTKSERYYFDSESIKEPSTDVGRPNGRDHREDDPARRPPNSRPHTLDRRIDYTQIGRNKRTVWTVPTTPYAGAHFAVFPEKLIEPCILAGSRPGDIVFDPFMGAGTVAAVASRLGRRWLGSELNPQYVELQKPRAAQVGMPL